MSIMLTSRVRRVAIVAMSIVAICAVVVPAVALHAVPFRGVANAAIVDVEPMGDDLLLTVAATGTAAHLGAYSRTESLLLRPDGTFEGDLAFTAANGHQLYANVEGGFTSEITAVGTYAFTGGTGRFAGATGSADFAAVTVDGAHFVITFDGTISY
jgi:hypothetical protein